MKVEQAITGKLKTGEQFLVSASDFDVVKKYKWYRLDNHSSDCRASTIYAYAGKNGRSILMHRLILRPKKGEQIDHINHDGLDNRRENLRIVSQSVNNHNRRKSVFGVRPVLWLKDGKYVTNGRYSAQIKIEGMTKWLGAFETLEAAKSAYKKALDAILKAEQGRYLKLT